MLLIGCYDFKTEWNLLALFHSHRTNNKNHLFSASLINSNNSEKWWKHHNKNRLDMMTGVSVTCLHTNQINKIFGFGWSILVHQACIFMINCLDKQYFIISYFYFASAVSPLQCLFYCISVSVWFWWDQWAVGENYHKCKHN